MMTYTKLQFRSLRRAIFRSRAFAQSVLCSSDANLPVLSSLARPRVMLSPSVIAYYELIRDGGILSPAYRLRPASPCLAIAGGGIPSFPHFTLPVFPLVPSPIPRRSTQVQLIVASLVTLASTTFVLARQTHAWTSRFSSRSRNEAVEFTSATARRVACRSPSTAFTPKLSLPESPPSNVGYDYMDKQSIPMAGLTSARHAALW